MTYRRILLSFILIILPFCSFAQNEKKDIGTENHISAPIPTSPIGEEVTDKNISAATREIVIPPALADSIFMNNHRYWSRKDSLNNILQGLGYDMKRQYTANGMNYEHGGYIATFDKLSFYGNNQTDDHRGLLYIQSVALGIQYQQDNFSLQIEGNANRYLPMFGMGVSTLAVPFPTGATRQYGISGIATYTFSPNLNMTIFGTYYNKNPYFYMAAFPYVKTSRYGGYANLHNDKYGLRLGVQRYYDPLSHQWITNPIVAPSFNINRKIKVEVDFGPILRNAAESLLNKRHGNIGPVGN